MTQTPELWTATYDAENDEELADAYGKWASLYDHDTTEVMGYVGPQIAVQMLDKYVDSKECRILDAGCGTGLVGEILNDLGYAHVDAMDFSEDMLMEAQKKEVYDRLLHEDLNKGLKIPDNSYDATICVGTFTYAHVGPHAMDELIRVTRPGGHICFTIRDGVYQEDGYRKKMIETEFEKHWQLEELKEADYLIKEGVTAKFCTYKVMENKGA
ncbi:MAG: class I SAM-dependent methyltransferase [Proteobacteria bacterium]|nr:class I SAM-dependent methyltransferase [Pseudomonadota bacterium]MBU1386534.1 class I SAM-dependent methyltransferase [Pseudomonadota bacterium]MBU1544645.1 class I SAM-dependent methyltransferase [Pseudomonadota bacterium]MBU2431124.1 class I SAM-dependent methyltransferase [Pseudomonadota bacterium]MBU2481376.1 class I SAM-dependent methyltransferase [Pseudomonadota bacterium]